MDDLTIIESDDGVVFGAKIVPGSSRTCISGVLNGMLKVKISAPAEKGKANMCLIEFLAKQLGVKKKSISIISGQSNPIKQIQVIGVSSNELLEKLKK